jgi:hypothetical protein
LQPAAGLLFPRRGFDPPPPVLGVAKSYGERGVWG